MNLSLDDMWFAVEGARYAESFGEEHSTAGLQNATPGHWSNWRVAAAAPIIYLNGGLQLLAQVDDEITHGGTPWWVAYRQITGEIELALNHFRGRIE